MFLHFFFLLIFAYGFCEDVPRAPLLSSIDTEPSSIIDGCVNVISGSYFDHEVDLVVPGPEVLKIERLLVNNNLRPCMGQLSIAHPEWKFNDMQFFNVESIDDDEKNRTKYRNNYHGALGESLHFHYKHPYDVPLSEKECTINLSMLKHGHTNTSQGLISGQTNIRNNLFKYKGNTIELRKSDGSKLRFGAIHGCTVSYFLDEEICLNYLKKNYTYREGHELSEYSLSNWAGRNLSTIKREEADAGLFREITYTTPDGRFAKYRFVKDIKEAQPYAGVMNNRLHEVIRSDKPNILNVYALSRVEKIKYSNDYGNKKYHIHNQVIAKHYPENRYINLDYCIKESMKAKRETVSEWEDVGSSDGNELITREIDNASAEFGRIKTLSAPLGCDAAPVQKYRFNYHLPEDGGGCTGVYDALNRLTNYSYNNRNRLQNVIKYDASGIPYTAENLYWGPQDTHKEIELSARTFGLFYSPYKTFLKSYNYDIAGNVIQEFLAGNLTGKNETNTLLVDANGIMVPGTADCLIKSHEYSWDTYNLLTKTTVGTKSIRNVFIPNTNLLSACFHADHEKTYLRHFYFYNDTGMVIKHLIDDGVSDNFNDLTGVTERKIELIERTDSYPVGFPLVVTELCQDLKTGQEHLLGRKVNTYDKSGKLLLEEIYGNDGEFAFSKAWEYDAHGNIVNEVRPDGAITTRSYDLNDNMISETGPNPLETKDFTYDFMNRLIKIQEHHPDILLSKHFRYDVCGNLLAKVDAMGNETRTHYDDFNRPISVEGGEVSDENGRLYRPITRYEYNELSHPTKITAPDGSVTEFSYTLYGKPCKIAYPDGTIERFEYDIEGRLIKEITKNGSIALHTYDAQNRMIKTVQLTASGDEVHHISCIYNTFHLLEKTDPEGNVTNYSYDCYGRLTSERKGEFVTSYEYDSLNRCCKTTIGESVKCFVFNCLGQVVEERTENIRGDVLTRAGYSYDIEGNKVRLEQDSEAGLIVASQVIDTHGIPIETVDPEGNVTRTRLDLNYFNSKGQRVIRTETTDPLGLTTVLIKDTQGQLAEQIKLNLNGEEIQKTAYIYNSSGKCIRTIETVYRGEESAPDVINSWEYNSMNQLVCMVQAVGCFEEKRVTYTYNGLSQLESMMKPDGVSLQYFYDGLGRLLEEKADNNSIHYLYTYDSRSNPVRVENLVNNSVTSRCYDEHNRVTLEKLANGLELEIAYNADGGLSKVTLPDRSSINYTYNGPLLASVVRKAVDGSSQYQHTYTAFDLSGNLLAASLINNLGELTSRYTLKGQPKEQKTSYYSESLELDPMNNIISKSYRDTIGQDTNKYAYDALHQLKEESGHFNHHYTNDSLYNRSSKDGSKYALNSLNCILSDGDANYSYDACGNVTSYTKNQKSYSFSYDALDRLTQLKIDDTTYAYTYDEQNRCIARLVTSSESVSEKILFVGQCDIGTTDQNNKIKNLRILGKGKGAEIGAAVAIELNGEIFAPIHDHQGNVIALIDSNGNARESYRYSAFGEEAVFDASGCEIAKSIINNPWRFSSKRKEADFTLFGRRFYNPDLGRWLTPDPAGHEAGPNLYAYVSNSPLSHFDQFGFLEESEGGGFFSRLGNSIRDGWNSCKDYVSRGFESARDGVSSFGDIVLEISVDVIPYAHVKEICRAAEYYRSNGTLSGFEFSEEINRSCHINFGFAPHPQGNVAFVVANGIDNQPWESVEMGMTTSKTYGGCNVHVIYTASANPTVDVGKCVINKLGISTPAVYWAVETIRSAIKEVGGIGIGIVRIEAHSRGGLVLNLALQHLTPEEKSMLYVCTFGSATLIKPEGLEYCINYVSKNDYIPWSDPIGIAEAKMGLRPDVVFIEPIEKGWFEHGINCETYKQARIRDAENFQKNYM